MRKRKSDIVRRYVHQQVHCAKSQGILSDFLGDIRDILVIFDDIKLEAFLSNSLVEETKKRKIIQLFQGSGSDFMDNFFSLILRERQYSLVYRILREIIQYSQTVTGQYDVTVVSVVPLTKEQRKRLIDVVQDKFIITVRQIIEKHDATILGGFVVEVDHKIMDASIRHQLRQAKINFR